MFWPKSKFFENFTEIDIFGNFRKKIEIFRNFDQNRNFSKILPKSIFLEIFEKKIEIFRNFDQNLNFSKISPKSEFSEIFE